LVCDALGRQILAVSSNKMNNERKIDWEKERLTIEEIDTCDPDLLVQWQCFDIQGRVLLQADARLNENNQGNTEKHYNFEFSYPISAGLERMRSADAGANCGLIDVHGNTVLNWDAVGNNHTYTYDRLQRPLQHMVSMADNNHSTTLEVCIYGEYAANADAKNLHILYNIEYDNVLVQNYQGTYSKWANSVENSRKICQVRSNNLFAVRNRVGAIYMNNGNVGYLFCLKISEIALEAFTIENSKCRVDINKYVDCLMVDFSYNLDLSDREKFSVERFFSNVVSELREKACTHIESVMNRAIQQEELGLPKTKFSDLKPNLELVLPPKEESDDKVDFTGPYGIYACEFFFHAPMAVAASLAGSFQYTAARNWYHKVFNVLGVEEKNKKEVWQYLPFYDHKSAYLSIIWNKGDKKICFSNGVKTAYFSNAQPYIAFDDSNGIIYVLCTQIYNTTESLYLLTSLDGGNEWEYLRSLIQVVDSQKAMGIIVSPNRLTLYYNGNKMIHSEIISIFWSKEETVSYIPQWAQLTTIETTRKTNTLDPDIIADSNPEVFMRWTLEQYIRFILEAADRQFMQESWESLSAATQLYFEAEDLLGGKPHVQDLESEYEKETKRTYENVQNVNVSFMKPTNRNLKSLWDWVNDRLYKLRNGLNINGERQLPSMNNDAEIPWRLVLNLRNGRVNLTPTEELFSSKTIYRFRDLLPATETMINMLSEFGNQLYGALTQKDNEQLQALQATHQVNLLNTTKNLYDYQVNEATKDLEALRVNALSVQAQYNYYSGLIAEG